ncbi:MAG: endonuclease MutS2 [Proteobacteria bacterium]|nr:endonuclease MutS2 [Pseudomonadota bacterium]
MINEDVIKSLEFDRLLLEVSSYAHSAATVSAVMMIRPFSGRENIENRSAEVEELRCLTRQETPLALSHFEDISLMLEELRPEGAVLKGEELRDFIPVLDLIGCLSSQLSEREDLVFLEGYAEALTGFPDILRLLSRSLDAEGKVLDKASPELASLRLKTRALSSRIGRHLEELVRKEDTAIFLQDDFITRRGGRWVIPVRMDSKGQVPGVVHDVSNTGETAFVEPLAVIGMTNELEGILADEKAEVIRILRGICRKIRVSAGEIALQYTVLCHLDMISSIAAFADEMSLFVPELNTAGDISILGARHPLLMLQESKGVVDKVVPLDLNISGKDSVMVITGPNAGGKTIAIKTVGLIVLMALSGMPVPAEASSSIPIIDSLLIDIGDEQSIEASLSTFSAHISRISGIIDDAGADSLILLDELGTGTEPGQGAAIACAVLKELKDRGAVVLTTTHLSDIVGFVFKQEGMVNAAMEFDSGTHRPLYRLQSGEPGQSYAIETAERYGLPERVVRYAREMSSGMSGEFHSLLKEMKEKRQSYEKSQASLEEEKALLAEKLSKVEAGFAEVKRIKEEASRESLEEAKKLIARAKRQAYDILEEIKKEKGRGPLKKLEAMQVEVGEKLRSFADEPPLSIDDVKVGEIVYVDSLACDAKVLKVDSRRGQVLVEAGNLKAEVSAASIREGRGKKASTKAIKHSAGPVEDKFSSSLKLIGLRSDEAIVRLEHFLDEAIVRGVGEVKVVHGVGTGALIKAVRGYLDNYPLVKGYRRGEQGEGGDGVTVVKLG